LKSQAGAMKPVGLSPMHCSKAATPTSMRIRRARPRSRRNHDREAFLDRARELQTSLTEPDLHAGRDLGAVVRAVEDDCRQLHARYARDRARLFAIADRMAAGLDAPALVGRRAAG
jgi:hypothetical protein